MTNIRLLIGGDSLQRKHAIADIQNRRYGDIEVEQLFFDAATGDTERAIDEVLSFSLFNPDRIVILDRVDMISKSDLELLVEYASHPRGDTPFLLISSSEKETPSALTKILDKKVVRVLPKTKKAEIQKIVLDRCAAQKISFERDALQFFLEVCGDNVDAAQRELDKLTLWADEEATITLDLCQRLIQTEQDTNVWAITNAVGDKNTAEALKALDLLLSQGDDEVSITGRLISTFRGLYFCKALSTEKTPDAEFGKRLGQSGYGLKMTRQRSERFSIGALRNVVELLRRADNDLKGGRYVPSADHKRILLERLVIDLCAM